MTLKWEGSEFRASLLRGRVSTYSVPEEASVVVLSADVEVPRTDPDVEVEESSIDEDVESSVVAVTSPAHLRHARLRYCFR